MYENIDNVIFRFVIKNEKYIKIVIDDPLYQTIWPTKMNYLKGLSFLPEIY